MNLLGLSNYSNILERYNSLPPKAQELLSSIFQDRVNREMQVESPVGVDSIEVLKSKTKKTVSFSDDVKTRIVLNCPEDKVEKWLDPRSFSESKKEAKFEITQYEKRLREEGRAPTKELVYRILYQPDSMKIHVPLIALD